MTKINSAAGGGDIAEMKRKHDKAGTDRGIPLFLSIIFVFCMLGAVVFTVSRKISVEMSESAIQNLSESLDLIKGTTEAILQKEAEFQQLIAQELATIKDPEKFIRSYNKNSTMVRMSFIPSGETEGVSNMGDGFSAKDLDFSEGKTAGGLPVSQSYLNYMGTWAYTMKCPVLKDEEEIATLYIEYVYDSSNEIGRASCRERV